MSSIYEENNDMQKLQQEAIRRAREMQSKAKNNVENTGRGPQHKQRGIDKNGRRSNNRSNVDEDLKEQEAIGDRNIHKKEHKANQISESPQSNIIQNIMKNKDQNLILILILILVGEEADAGLILALLYLIM